MASLIGQSLGRHHILEQLGEGGMAVVYKAYDTLRERNVAIKIIRKGAFPAEQLERILKRFEHEAKAVARLSHPNIVKVHDFGEYDGSPYLVMEYLPGGTLKGKMGQPFPWQVAARLLLPVAHALAYAHQQGILHRDVKPSNILITGTGDPMLTDFGIAKILDMEETHTLTGSGVGIGTPEYMSPEEGLGKEIDARADVYSLGIIFYELVTGRKPYTADTPQAVIIKQVNEPLPPPRQFVPSLPGKVERVLLKALAKAPENRYLDMGAFAAALESLTVTATQPAEALPTAEKTLDALPSQVKSSQPFGPARPVKPARLVLRWLPLAGAAVLVCIGLALGAFWLIWTKPVTITPAQSTMTSIARLFTVTPTDNLTTATLTVPPIPSSISILTAATLTVPPTPSSTSILTPTQKNQSVSPLDGMVLLLVPQGAFTMGTNTSNYADEKPAHKVVLDAFWIDKYEVTNAMFLQFVDTTGYITELEQQNLSWLFDGSRWYSVPGAGWRKPLGMSSSLDNRMDHPVIQVSWDDAQKYCAWAGRRLPTEAEWEKAARGTDANEYPWGNSAPSSDLANYGDKIGDTVPGGSYPGNASPYGALDMAGNVYEWVADWYSNSYYSVSPSSNPTGPASGTHKVMHGGSWQLDAYRLHPYEREVSQPDTGNSNLGFRCAKSANP